MEHFNPDYLRLSIFLGVFGVLAIIETLHPRRKMEAGRPGRWFTNLSLTFIDGILVRLVLGAAAYGAAQFAADHSWGFLNDVELSWPVEFAIGFIFLDMMVYLQHVLSHALPFLWRFHLVHHSDLEFDVTTALRFHPVETIILMFYKIGLVAAMGIDPWAVVIFEVVHTASVQFNHSNIKFSQAFDAKLRRIIITPDFHRVHHSMEPEETNSNFGFFLPWWDMLFGTYRPRPAVPHNVMQIGLAEYREPEELSLPGLLLMPANPRMGAYSFGKSEE